jgi:hypothetical protein
VCFVLNREFHQRFACSIYRKGILLKKVDTASSDIPPVQQRQVENIKKIHKKRLGRENDLSWFIKISIIILIKVTLG